MASRPEWFYVTPDAAQRAGHAEVSQLRGDTAEPIARYRQAMALLRDAAEGALARQAQSALDADQLPPYTRSLR